MGLIFKTILYDEEDMIGKMAVVLDDADGFFGYKVIIEEVCLVDHVALCSLQHIPPRVRLVRYPRKHLAFQARRKMRHNHVCLFDIDKLWIWPSSEDGKVRDFFKPGTKITCAFYKNKTNQDRQPYYLKPAPEPRDPLVEVGKEYLVEEYKSPDYIIVRSCETGEVLEEPVPHYYFEQTNLNSYLKFVEENL